MKIKILIVEDEVLVAEEIAADLSDSGFHITNIAISSEECFSSIIKDEPHIILIDINIKGRLDGIETVQIIKKTHNIPIVYLTASSDTKTINRVMSTSPSAFISKPYTKNDLVVALELAFNNHNNSIIENIKEFKNESFFVKSGDFYAKIRTSEILYIEADGSYCKIHSNSKTYMLSNNLNYFENKLRNSEFVRIHRSYIINTNKVEAFNKNTVIINNFSIPISRAYQKNVLPLFLKL